MVASWSGKCGSPGGGPACGGSPLGLAGLRLRLSTAGRTGLVT